MLRPKDLFIQCIYFRDKVKVKLTYQRTLYWRYMEWKWNITC